MKTVFVSLPDNLVSAFARWLEKWPECRGMSIPAGFALSIRQVTPTGPQDSRWHRSLDYRMPGRLTCRQLLSRVNYWRRVHPCQTYTVVLYDEYAEAIDHMAYRLEITVEDWLTKCIAYHASLTGGREFEETVFDRFERALARDFRDEKAKRAERAAAAIETGLTVVDLDLEIPFPAAA